MDDDTGGLETLAGTHSATQPAAGAAARRGGELAPRTRSGIEGLQGREIGRYVVLERLGEGAMGVVLAAYDPELDRKVALKLLHPRERSSRSHDGHLRLLAEAQALARLSDPHVVTVHDVGTHEGRVFVAMEFVEGQTLGRWLAQGRRPWREVLDVMLRAGRGLVAAHARDLVHRDFKPENVMIGRDGRVRVMDFGLARADGETSSGATPSHTTELDASQPRQRALDLQLTRHGALVGTPAYMAPEHLAGSRSGAEADQFSFCVTLWEALHGQRPFVGDTLPELQTRILEGAITEPPAGASVPRWLRRVVERGLAVEPERRWPSMQALLHALERGLERTRWRRGLAAVAGVGVIAASVWGVGRYDALRRQRACEAEGASIEAVWNDEVAEAARAAMVATGAPQASFTLDKARPWLDAHAQAWQEARTEACVRAEVEDRWDAATYERARWCLDDRRLELAALVDGLREGDARSVRRAVQAAAGLELDASCIDDEALARMPARPADSEELAAVRADLWRVHALGEIGDLEQGLALARTTLARAEALDWPPLAALARLRLGTLLTAAGEHADAARIIEAAYFEAAEADELEVAFMAASQLVSVLGYQLARHEEALRWARHAELVLARLPGANEVFRAPLLVDVSTVEFVMGEYTKAQATGERVLAVYEQALGPVHPLVADALTNLGLFHQAQGHYAEAKALLERALDIREQTQGTLHSQMADLLSNIGGAELRLGASARAVELFERALAIREANLGPDHPSVCSALGNLGAAHHERGDDELAAPLFERAVAICERALGPDDIHTAGTRSNYADTLRTLGRLDDAREQLEHALRAMEAALGPTHPDLSYPLQGLALVAEAQGRFDDAVIQAERAMQVRRAAGSASDLVAEARFVLARVQWQRGLARDEALAHARQAVEEYRTLGSTRTEEIAEIEQWLATHAPGG